MFLIFSLYSAAASLLQIIYFMRHPPAEFLEKFFTHMDIMKMMPPAFTFFFDHILFFSVLSLAFSLASLAASRAFLKRRDWARVFFAVVMILSIVLSAACLFILDAFNFSTPGNPGMREMVREVNRILRIYIMVMIPMIAAFHGWLAYKLLSKQIKEEFENYSGKGPF